MKLTCIICPMGCELTINQTKRTVSGQLCPRGTQYALDEMTDPKRVYTGNIRLQGGVLPVISFKTDTMRKADLPHLKAVIEHMEVSAPIALGEVLYRDHKLTITATRTIERT